MFIEREEEGVWLREMPMWVVDTLLCLPDWIESDNPDVRARLMPKAYEDEERDREWREALGSSLEHLFAKRTEIVRADLQKLQIVAPDEGFVTPPDDDLDDDPDSDLDDSDLDDSDLDDNDPDVVGMQTLFDVWIPGVHVSAWVSTLQAGTHAIFILEGLTAEDVALEGERALEPEKHVAIMRLSILQEVLVSLLESG